MALMLADKFSTSNDVLVFFDKQGIEMVVEALPIWKWIHLIRPMRSLKDWLN